MAPAPGGPEIATREPRPNGTFFRLSGPVSFWEGKTGVRSPNQGRSSAGSAGAPFTVSMRTREGWRSLRRALRAGPLTSSPARSSQRRIWAGETYTSSRVCPAGSTRTKPLPLASTSSTPVAIVSSEISSSTTSGSSSATGARRPRPPRATAPCGPLERLFRRDLVGLVVGLIVGGALGRSLGRSLGGALGSSL